MSMTLVRSTLFPVLVVALLTCLLVSVGLQKQLSERVDDDKGLSRFLGYDDVIQPLDDLTPVDDDDIQPPDDLTPVDDDDNGSVGNCFSEKSIVWGRRRYSQDDGWHRLLVDAWKENAPWLGSRFAREGTFSMSELKVGDEILTKEGIYQTVYAFAHRQEKRRGIFLQIHSKGLSQPLEVTGSHLVYLENQGQPVRADFIQVGDDLRTLYGPAKVSRIKKVEREGVYAPLTMEGTLVVDDVMASSYISFQKHGKKQQQGGMLALLSDHQYAHIAMAPFRMLCFGVSSSICQFEDPTLGMPVYVSLGVKVNEWLVQQNPAIKVLALVVIIALTGACWIVESIFGPSWAPLAVTALVVACSFRKRNLKKIKMV